MKVLSLDNSTKSTGYSVWCDEELLYYGCIKSNEDNLYSRIKYMGSEIDKLIKENNIQLIYAEEVPLISNNTATMLTLGTLKGYILGVANYNNIEIKFIPVGTWRKEIDGMFDGTKEGKTRLALKKRSIEIANEIYGLELIYKSPTSRFNSDDISDSILLFHSIIHPKELKSKPNGFGTRR